jgi:hypothetical protein
MNETMRAVRADCAAHLDRIRRNFKNPKITLIVRSPESDEGDFVLTEDDLDEAIKALERSKARPEIPPGPA